MNLCQTKYFKVSIHRRKKQLVVFFPFLSLTIFFFFLFFLYQQFRDVCEHLFLFSPLYHCDVQYSPEHWCIRIRTGRGWFRHIISCILFCCLFCLCLNNQCREKSSLRECFSAENQQSALKSIYPLAIFEAHES